VTAPALQLFATLFPRSGWAVGAGVRVQLQPQDASGAVVAVTGTVMTVLRPDRSRVQFSGDSLGSAPAGPYLDLVLDQAGAWQVEATVTGPRQAVVTKTLTVAGSDVTAPSNPGPVWTTRDLWTVWTQQGAPITAVRMPALPDAGTPADADLLVTVRENVSYKQGWGALRSAAVAAANSSCQ